MRDLVIDKVRQLFSGYLDLVRGLPDGALEQSLSEHSNTIGAQLWCVVGARESTTASIARNEWVEFSCSLTAEDIKRPERIEAAMEQAIADFESTLNGMEWTPIRENVILGLLEHETQHQGQLLRFMYAREYQFPDSWAQRWNL